MRYVLISLSLVVVVLISVQAQSAAVPISESSAECIDCHSSIHPGIVKDWQQSRHAKITPKEAIVVEGLARKVSAKSVPENLLNTAVGCAECHMLRPKAHADTFEHSGYDIHVVVSPDDCRTCHPDEAEQYSKNLMSHAYNNLAGNEIYQFHQQSIIGETQSKTSRKFFLPANEDTKAEACYYCHGTKLKVTGFEVRDTEAAGELEFPVIEGWPNQGVGRVNLDASLGSCSACHTRHTFSIEMARKPFTCQECHVGPDVPAFKVYAASKHGNIFSAMHKTWNFNAVPWTIGKDFTAPTCATCHISLLVNTDEEVVSERTHQVSNRLPWRIFGIIYAHPHPQLPDTTIIRNKDGQPLPTEFDRGFATDYLISGDEMDIRRKTMQAACLNCHGTSWVRAQWKRFENTIQTTNADTLIGTRIMQEIWRNGFAIGLDQGGNPFDEAVEKKWSDTWLLYANTIRFASAMGCGGDYGVFAGGRYQLSQTLLELDEWLELRKAISPEKLPKSPPPAE
ncbi:MAG: hydroxylamine oxidase [Desulfobacterales bacterium]|nr:MAG: hydroxylamine oxidase [Desulfobacterales bacterium]